MHLSTPDGIFPISYICKNELFGHTAGNRLQEQINGLATIHAPNNTDTHFYGSIKSRKPAEADMQNEF